MCAVREGAFRGVCLCLCVCVCGGGGGGGGGRSYVSYLLDETKTRGPLFRRSFWRDDSCVTTDSANDVDN